jgi:hypothetical protein
MVVVVVGISDHKSPGLVVGSFDEKFRFRYQDTFFGRAT